MKKRLAVIAMALCLVVAGAAMGTVAYFTAQETAHNVITTGGVAIALEEWASLPDDGTDPVPFEDVEGVLPGTAVGKVVQVSNTGASEAWVRIQVEKTIVLDESREGEIDPSLISLDINTATEPLFTQVSFDKEMGNLYQNCTAQVDVSAQAVQTANNGAAAPEAAGWPEA